MIRFFLLMCINFQILHYKKRFFDFVEYVLMFTFTIWIFVLNRCQVGFNKELKMCVYGYTFICKNYDYFEYMMIFMLNENMVKWGSHYPFSLNKSRFIIIVII
jgi:hypothetical protein